MLPSWEYKCNYIYLKSSFDLALEGVCHLLAEAIRTQGCAESLHREIENSIEKYCDTGRDMKIYTFRQFMYMDMHPK